MAQGDLEREPDRTRETVAGIAYHIDKTCTGGTDEDFVAAEAIRAEFVAPLEAERDRYRKALEEIVRDVDPNWPVDRDLWQRALEIAAAALDQKQASDD